MTMRGFETVGVRAVIQGLPEYLAGAKAITSANVGISGSLKGAEGISTGFKLLGAAIATVSAAIAGAAVVSASRYETSLAKIDALTKTTTEDTERLGVGLLKIAKTVPKSPDELGAAAYFALSSGIEDVDEALALVESAAKASAAGLGSTADIVDIVTAAMNAYGHESLTAARATDVLVAAVREGKGEPAAMATALGRLLPLAAALKIPFEDLAATFASLTNALGGSGAAEQAGTQLLGILNQIASPSREAKNALAEAEAGVRHLSQEELDLADAHRAVTSAADSYSSAQRSLRNSTEDVARATRDATQAQLDARKELLSVQEAEQRLISLKARAPQQALQEKAAILALADAQKNLNETRRKGNAGDIARAQLDLANAEQRLKEIRADAPQAALDLRGAEIALAEARNRQGQALEQQTRRQRDAAEAQIDARRGVARAASDLALASEKETLAQIRTRDAYADLRKEIAEKGLVPTLQRLNTLFADNQEGLAKLFPDVRAFTGFLSAITSQGTATASILDRIKKSAGITDEAFARMSKTTAFQSSLLKNQLNVGLIQLGTVALPGVNAALGEALRILPRVGEAFSGIANTLPNIFAGINNALSQTFGQIAGGSFKTNFFAGIAESAKDAGKAVSELGRLFKLGLAGGDIGGDIGEIQQAVFDFGTFLRETVIPAFHDATEAVRLFFLGLAGGEVGGEISALQQSLFELGATVRQQWFDVIRPAIEEASAAVVRVLREQVIPTIKTLADIVATTAVAINDNWESIRAVLEPVFKAMVETVKSAFAIFAEQLKLLQAFVQGVDDLIHGRWSEVWEDAKDFVGAAFEIIKGTIERQVIALPKLFIELGIAVAKTAAAAGVSIGKAFGNGIIDAINDMLQKLSGLTVIPSVRIAGRTVVPEVKLPNIGRPIPRLAKGDIVREPTFALIGEEGPEAVLPLTNLARSRAILGSLPETLLASMLSAKRMADGGVVVGAGYRSQFPQLANGQIDIDAAAAQVFDQYFGSHSPNAITSGGGGGGGSVFASSSTPIYATLPPSLIRSMQPANNGGVTFESMFGGAITVGATSREVEALVVNQIHGVFARARQTTNLTGSLITGGVG